MYSSINLQKQKPSESPPEPFEASHYIAKDVLSVVESTIWGAENRKTGGESFPVEVSTGSRFPCRDCFTVFVESERKLKRREVTSAAAEILYHIRRKYRRTELKSTYYNKKNVSGKYTIMFHIDFKDDLEYINSTLDFWVTLPKVGAQGHFEYSQNLYLQYCAFAAEKYAIGDRSGRFATLDGFVQTLKNAGVSANEGRVWHWMTGAQDPTESQS